jgi:proteasome activator subunit 4
VILHSQTDFQFHPSYPSAKALTDDVLSDPADDKDLMCIRRAPFEARLTDLRDKLSVLKMERPHGPKAAQSEHDLTASSSERIYIVTSRRADDQF